ncbi:MAG: hypothetical protein FWG30_09230 [Eubacteriaceae bacterium]|nr:hypothetical protein [Eubacteriaceae bacterium]
MKNKLPCKRLYRHLSAAMLFIFALAVLPLLASADDCIVFTDPNLQQALLREGLDANSDGEISISEALEAIELRLIGSGISSLAGLEHFTNLEYLDIRDNYISDLSPLLSLDHLGVLLLHGNTIDSTPLRKCDAQIIELINGLQDRGVIVEGAESQIIDYNPALLPHSRVYNVLFVYVAKIDVLVKQDWDSPETGYFHELSGTEVQAFDEYRRMFELYVEKLSDYSVDITTASYITQETVTELAGYPGEYSLFAENIAEIQGIANSYDSIIVCLMLNDEIVPHTPSGLGGFSAAGYGDAMIYFRTIEDYGKTLADASENRNLETLEAIVHEFCHTVEYYASISGLPIWEFHDAQAFYGQKHYATENSHINAIAAYLQGTGNPNGDGTKGITNEVWENPPSKKREFEILKAFEAYKGPGPCTAIVNEDLSRFYRLMQSGSEISPDSYSVSSTGTATIITLNESYLSTLANGTYEFLAEFTFGYCKLSLSVKTGSPFTGDQMHLAFIALPLAAMLGLLSICLKKMRERQT